MGFDDCLAVSGQGESEEEVDRGDLEIPSLNDQRDGILYVEIKEDR